MSLSKDEINPELKTSFDKLSIKVKKPINQVQSDKVNSIFMEIFIKINGILSAYIK